MYLGLHTLLLKIKLFFYNSQTPHDANKTRIKPARMKTYTQNILRTFWVHFEYVLSTYMSIFWGGFWFYDFEQNKAFQLILSCASALTWTVVCSFLCDALSGPHRLLCCLAGSYLCAVWISFAILFMIKSVQNPSILDNLIVVACSLILDRHLFGAFLLPALQKLQSALYSKILKSCHTAGILYHSLTVV